MSETSISTINNRLRTFCAASKYVAESFRTIGELDQALARLAEDGRDAMSAESFAIFVTDPANRDQVCLRADSTRIPDSSNSQSGRLILRVHDGKAGGPGGLTGYLAYQKQAVILSKDSLFQHPQRTGGIPRHLRTGRCVTLIVVPLLDSHKRLLGLIKVENIVDENNEPDEFRCFEELDLLMGELIGNQVAIILQSLEIRREEESLRGVLDQLPLCVYNIDRSKRLTMVNSKFCELHSMEPRDLIGKSACEIHPIDLAEAYEADDETVFNTQAPLIRDEIHFIREKGYPVNVIKIPIFDPLDHTRVAGIKGIFWLNGTQENELGSLAAEIERQTKRRTASLSTEIEKLKSALHSIDQPTILLEKGVIYFANHTAMNLLASVSMGGRRVLEGTCFLDLCPEADRNAWKEWISQATSTEREPVAPRRGLISTVKGQLAILAQIRLMRSGEGQALLMLIDQVEAMANQDFEELQILRMLADLTPVLMYVKDQEHRFIYGNRALASHYHAGTPKDMEGSMDQDYCVVEDELKAFDDDDDKILTQGWKYIERDEEPVTPKRTGVTHYYKTFKVPITHPATGELCVLGVSIEIADNSAAPHLLRQIMDNVPDAMCLKSAGGELIYTNSAFDEWCQVEKIGDRKRLAKNEWDYAPLSPHQSLLKAMDQFVSESTTKTSCSILRIREPKLESDANRQPVTYRELTKFPIVVNDEVNNILVVCRDRTELEKTVHKLRQAVLYHCLFTHDASSPLREITHALSGGSLEQAAQSAADLGHPEALICFNAIVESTRNANALRTDLPSLVRTRAFEQIDLMRFLHDLKQYQESLHPKYLKIELQSELGGVRPDVFGNEKLLLMAFNKLIENSYRHGREGRPTDHLVLVTIMVRSATHAEQWVVELVDNGMGYRNDIISSRMYEEEVGLAAGGNLGLGLRITEAIIAHHSGSTAFGNCQPRHGAKTILRLPKKYDL